jgi:hypothetical protein
LSYEWGPLQVPLPDLSNQAACRLGDSDARLLLFPVIGHPLNMDVAFSPDLVEFRVASQQNSVVLLGEGSCKAVRVSNGAFRLQMCCGQSQVSDLCRNFGISDATYCNWKARFAGMTVVCGGLAIFSG